MSLEDLIRAKQKAGELTHLSLVAHWEKDRKVSWSATCTNATKGIGYGSSKSDPVEAIRFALEAKAPAPRKPRKVMTAEPELEDWEK
jgi:hypothetical protein